jgi:hypothetical protein
MRTILAIAILGGCMMSSSDGMRDPLRDAQREQAVHATQSRAAADLPSLVAETDRHSAHMTVILDDMDDHMSTMRHCSGMGSIMDMRDVMQTEVEDHRTTMHAVAELTVARAEDEHYMAIMSDMLDDMDIQLDSMHCGGM